MFQSRKFAQLIFSSIIVLSLGLSVTQPQSVSAQRGDGLKRQVNAESGKVSFIGPESGNSVPASKALGVATLARPSDPAMSMAKRFAPEFGLKNPERDLSVKKSHQTENGRISVRYQQNYQGIPVMGGELIVNTNANGDLYSINGEVSPELSLSTEPAIDSAQAKQTALQAVAKWYQSAEENFAITEPELWIYDESLLHASTREPELVWRMEVISVDNSLPLRELVLIDAQRGNISLHFNQIDTAWHSSDSAESGRASVDSTIASSNSELSYKTKANQNTSNAPYTQVGTSWYVATTGNDSNSCAAAGSPCLTINGAIGKATAGDTIKIAIGTYTGSGTQVVQINKSVTLSGGWNAGFTTQSGMSTIDAQNSRRGVSISAGTSLERFTIKNGNASGSLGGGVYILADVSITVTNSSIQSNSAQVGGGIYKTSGSHSLTLNNTTISNNSAFSGGGMEFDGGSLILNNSRINFNTASSTAGGIYLYGSTLALNNTTISNNLATDWGGGIFVHTANLTSNNSTISNNSATDSGGGIYVQAQTNSNVSIKNSILAGNFSKFGSNCSGSLTSNGTNMISNTLGCSVTATTGDKFNINPLLGTFLPAQGYHPLLPGSPAINSGNSATCLPTDQRGVARVGPCDIGAYEYKVPAAATSLTVVSGDGQRTPPNFTFLKPLMAIALDNQGSPVSNINITFAAPASGAGGTFSSTGTITTSAVTNTGGVATSSTIVANNQFGNYSVSASAGGLSPISFNLENAGLYVSTSGNDSNSCAIPGSPCRTINAAISKSTAGDTILVATGTYTGTDSFAVTIPKSLNLSGGWNAGFTTQTGSSIIDSQSSRLGAYVYGGVATIATLERFAIINGSGGSAGEEGGGVLNYGTLTLNNVTLSNNVVNVGGGIYNGSSGILTLNNVTISNNSAWFGGGIYNSNGTLIIKNTLIGGNSTRGPSGQGPDCFGTIISNGFNILSDSSDCTMGAHESDLLNIDPQLGSFNSAQGYFPLLLGSPAIEAGNSSTCLSKDQIGISRPQGQRCDIGGIEYQFNYSSSLVLKTFSAGNQTTLSATFLCDQTDLACSAGDNHSQAAHRYAAGIYNLYKNQFNRNSLDGNGIEVLSSVHYSSNFSNAFWNGYMMVYGDAGGWPLADDVVAHEYTHGVTQYESNLFYYYQSGAINESFSDLWGEYYDQINGLGNDAANVKWLHAEDVSGYGPNRSMSNPPAFGDPDRMSSTNYYEGEDDSGGVHTNSGINNKAVYLMVDGGTFNGKTVTSLGWDKTAAIYYEVNTNLLSSGADYSDLYFALQQACSNLIGQNGIVAGDCTEVKDAIDAVEMNAQPAPNFNSDVALCGAGITPVVTFADNLESGTAKWTFNNGAYSRWQYDSPLYGSYAHSGQHSLYAADDPDLVTDATARLTAFTVSSNAYLHFSHAYDFEAYLPSPGPYYFDGGVLEYSTNGGSSWTDAGSLMNFNGYDAVLYTGTGNPLSGRSAFAGSSHGYISTRLNLASLADKNAIFRWRIGLDQALASGGWWVDDIKVYTCPAPANVSVLVGGTNMGNYVVQGSTSLKKSYPGVDNGPVKVQSNNGTKIVASERVAYSSDGGTTWTSHAELMGLPANLVHTSYTFPWYNNLTLDSQLRFGNVGNAPTDVTVTIAGENMGTYHLNLNQSRRISYPDLDNGPVVIHSNGQPIIASLRVAYTPDAGTTWTSFSEMMGLPSNQLTNSYTFPWYNNATLNSQLRFGNVGSSPTNVLVTIGGQVKGTYPLNPNASFRVSYGGLDSGPIKITSSGNVPIIASMRVAYTPDGGVTWKDFSEMMGLPTSSLSTRYSFPAYNNVNLNSQLRFGNVGTSSTNVTVSINGVVQGTYTVAPNASRRISYPLNSGPVVIQSSGGVPIIASLRVAYTPDGGTTWTSFSEMMGLPQSQLTTSYLFPWYNNVGLDTQLRFGVP